MYLIVALDVGLSDPSMRPTMEVLILDRGYYIYVDEILESVNLRQNMAVASKYVITSCRSNQPSPATAQFLGEA